MKQSITNLEELTIAEAAKGLRAKDFSASELTSAVLKRIAERDDSYHAYLQIFEEEAHTAAALADTFLAKKDCPLQPLLGIPIAIKDNILVKGKRCTAGSRILETYNAPYDATVIGKLKHQGAILLGKTNMDDAAMGSSTESSAFGVTRNPHDISRVPGGSSGGSAAAVAAHLSLGALGSDTGGSIRQPASFCGIVGFKPTYGMVSRHGLIAMASSLDQIGTMAKSVEDAEILFHAIRGEDAFDATCERKNRQHPVNHHSLKGVRIGIPTEYFIKGLDSEIEQRVREAARACEAAGASLKEISLPHTAYALPAYYIIVPSEVSANLARLDTIRYGSRQPHTTLLDLYEQSRGYGFGTEVKRRIMLGTYTLSAGYYDAYYLKAQKVRRLIREEFDRAFAHIDVILGPTTPTPAFSIGERTKDPLQMYLADIYTVAANLAGIPAVSLPAGFTQKDGAKLPIGLQLAGPRFGDDQLLEIARHVENALA